MASLTSLAVRVRFIWIARTDDFGVWEARTFYSVEGSAFGRCKVEIVLSQRLPNLCGDGSGEFEAYQSTEGVRGCLRNGCARPIGR